MGALPGAKGKPDQAIPLVLINCTTASTPGTRNNQLLLLSARQIAAAPIRHFRQNRKAIEYFVGNPA